MMNTGRLSKKFTALLGAAGLVSASTLCLQAAEQNIDTTQPPETFIEVFTYEELLQMAENPDGCYRLMDDINMEDLQWEPVDFSGVFDGNGYTLLNLEINSTGTETADTYDGNYKVYDTYFAGFFGTLKDAEVYDLSLVNVQVQVETDLPCFIGSIAGYSENSAVRGCNVQGRLELSAHDRMFGVGGIIGYGSGVIEQTTADVTLICTDTDASTRDEQFMGGAYAAGYLDLNRCSVTIDGYDSDHGYVHNGGLVGMYILYPKGFKYAGFLTDNSVTGRITFFEDNTDRRAYCKGTVGEVMNWTFRESGNTAAFERNELFEYSLDLKPDMCADAAHTEVLTPPGCDTFGYTSVKCEGCGYTYTDHYTLYQHTVTDWTVTQDPTTESTGIKTGVCTLCGMVLAEEVEKLAPTAEPSLADDSRESAAPEKSGSSENAPEDPANAAGSTGAEDAAMELFKNPVVIGVIIVLVLLLIVGEILVFKIGKR